MAEAEWHVEYLRSLPNFENVKVGLKLKDTQRADESVDELLARVVKKTEDAVQAKINEIDAEAAGANVTRKQR